MSRTLRHSATLAGSLALAFATMPAAADELPIAKVKAMCAAGDSGPRTTYGETKAEAANKRVMFEWTCMTLAEGKADAAFARYVARDFCDHSHMINGGLKPCSSYDETRKMFGGMAKMLVHDGMIEFPVASTVNGEIVTQYGAGADIWRVHDGKITDHWDGSPPVSVSLKAHDMKFSNAMQGQIDSGKRLARPPM